MNKHIETPIITGNNSAGPLGQPAEAAPCPDAVRMAAVIRECCEYLDTNNLTSIGHGSVLHRKLKEVAP